MKCPFRTIITKTNEFTNEINPQLQRIKVINEDMEFKDCLEHECPYWKWYNLGISGHYMCAKAFKE